MKKSIFVMATAMASFMFFSAPSSLNAQDVQVKTGAYGPEYDSLDKWECPEWFKDAKFGIWAHWGPQCHAEAGDWYARFMYYDGSGQNSWHWDHFGDPAEFGLKELCNDWKAENWDPEALVNLYKSVGARYFMTLGNHHDNFDLWDSPYQEWNSKNIGPKKDIIRGWSDACKKAGLPLGVSIHASHAWTWLEPSQDYDGNLTKEDGVGKWWEGMDPQELYAQRHEHSSGWDDSGTIHNQWEWGNGASLPSEEYKMKFQNRVLELINDYAPDMLYFDDTAMPFYGCDEQIGKNILTHYYNSSAENNDGTPNVVVTGKKLTTDQKDYMMWDVERGIPDKMQDDYWQTCTCLGNWHYEQSVYNNNGYKGAQQVVDMLVDIVSKNGNMLLSVPVKSDGTIDDKEQAILAGIKAWMDVNSSSIYGTRTWKTFGEGPLAETANALSGQGFNESNNYSAKDVRFVQRNDTLFATVMRWPSNNTFTIESLGLASEYYSGKVTSVKVLGFGDVKFAEDVDGLVVEVPSTRPNDIAPVYQITFDASVAMPTLSDIIDAYEMKARTLLGNASYNTGKFSKASVNEFLQYLEDSRQYESASESVQRSAIKAINAAYKKMKSEGRIPGGAPGDEDNATDLTVQELIQANNFNTTEEGTRFGTPANWTVENFDVPMNDPSVGNKNGIDKYPGYNTLSLGVWSGEDGAYTNDISNARIYRKVHLEPGRYYFGANFETVYNMSAGYMYAANSTLDGSLIMDESIAFADLAKYTSGQFYGINFIIAEEQDVVLAFQADLTTTGQQEFRIKEVKLLYFGNMNFDALNNLVMTADRILSEATINSNTGFFSKEAAQKLEAAMEAAQEIGDDVSVDEFTEAYNALQKAIDDFNNNGRNVGGAPNGNGEDITVEKLHEADNFARTPDTDTGTRFGKPLYWTVENFGFDSGGNGYQGGIDNDKGPDCLHLEVWWNNNAYPENGYDISNVRLYQLVDLPAGRYYFGAAYLGFEPNDQSYIFASDQILNTSEIPTNSIAFEKVNLAPRDQTFRGIYFTLDEPTSVYLGFQADFSNSSANNIRPSAVKLLYYGELSYDKLQELIAYTEEQIAQLKINNNTGYYSETAYATMQSVLETAKAVSSSADYDTVSDAYNAVTSAYADFIANGRNKGGQPEEIYANDITEQILGESQNFSRADDSGSSRFGSPKYWTVENYNIPSSSEGLRGGLDNYPGADCLTLGVWDDKGNAPAESDITSARVYQKVTLDAGDYYFGSQYDAQYQLYDAYVFASDEIIPTDEMTTNSIAYMSVSECQLDGKYWGIYFTIPEKQEVVLGWQANLLGGSNTQEFRAKTVKLIRYSEETSVELLRGDSDDAPVEIYSLQGMRLGSMPQHGFYIIRKGSKSQKHYAK